MKGKFGRMENEAAEILEQHLRARGFGPVNAEFEKQAIDAIYTGTGIMSVHIPICDYWGLSSSEEHF